MPCVLRLEFAIQLSNSFRHLFNINIILIFLHFILRWRRSIKIIPVFIDFSFWRGNKSQIPFVEIIQIIFLCCWDLCQIVLTYSWISNFVKCFHTNIVLYGSAWSKQLSVAKYRIISSLNCLISMKYTTSLLKKPTPNVACKIIIRDDEGIRKMAKWVGRPE